jgi:hypothetical protein
MFVTTDPYRPPVGLTPTDGTPLVVKRCEKLPSDGYGQSRDTSHSTVDVHVHTVQGGCYPYDDSCQKMSTVKFLTAGFDKESMHTKISPNFSWIMEVDHPQGLRVEGAGRW